MRVALEKMVEATFAKVMVIVDESKLVSGLGGSGLEMLVEVVSFCFPSIESATLRGCNPSFRLRVAR